MGPAAGTSGTPALFGVGYEGRDLDELVALLRANHVTVLLDVRLNAVSRKPGFSKQRLRAALEGAGIQYRHARALGNPKDNREPFHTGDTARGARTFRALLASDEAGLELGQLAELLASERVAVFCFERDHDRCHRQVIFDAIAGQRTPVHLP
ncbi:MAG: hypothetical protein QOE45_729 [Frankiaceae bacterium]|jgi:uncharacterized protein (DUF488 family)|nr:hypothetical protein [Frankiaceae bacterium]